MLRKVVDAVLLPSPYALSFGGFVNLPTSLWLGAGGVVASLMEAGAETRSDLPHDMSGTSLFGGGLIAGDALAALAIGVAGLLARFSRSTRQQHLVHDVVTPLDW